ncbi:MAG: acyltransferase [Burkholderiales bacterium]|nr:acyltransferase [Burkholderiales bacterium]
MIPPVGEIDRASYRNRGGLIQRVVSAYKAWRYVTRCGADVVIKRSVEFRLAQGAILEIGAGSTIQDWAFFQLTLPNPKVFIGENSVIGRRSIITAKNCVRIGNDVLMGSDVQVIDHSHGVGRSTLIRRQSAEIGVVEIGDDVWIGAGSKILMNARIGKGAIIGANAVVTHDIPEYGIAVGVPARVIRFRD